MPRNISLRSSVLLVCSIASLCPSANAHAQTVEAFDPGANQTVWTVAVQPDGKTVFGGVFTGLGGGNGATSRNHIGRLNVDGSVDMGFISGASGDVYAVAVQPDGKILVGGNFTTLGVGAGIMSRNRIGRLNSDGSVDASFNPGANLPVYALVVQPDGKILVGGAFSTLGGGSRIALGRLDANGVPDSFNPGASKNLGAPIVYTMALQTDGKIVVGGYFNGLGGGTGATGRNFIGRLDAAGTVDSFNPGASSISGINALAIQADGKIVVGGSFTGLGSGTGMSTLRANIGRINSDGLVDMGFNPGAEAQVLTLGIQADGKILAGGYFQLLGGGGSGSATRKYIGRLDANGLIDSTFNPGAGNVVNAVAVQPDGAVVVGGVFLTVGGGTGTGTPRARIARFTNTDAPAQTLALSSGNTVVTWARSGGGPEVSNVTFEWSTSGTIYTLLGSGARVAGGWELGGLSVPTKVYIRARGYYGTGYQTGSGSIVESILSPEQFTNGDFDGDGHTDIAIYRPSNGAWYVRGSSANYIVTWGGIGTDIPLPGDYDGDGKADIAIYRPSTGAWWVLQSSSDYTTYVSYTWGVDTDKPVPGDYDGDGRTDIAIYRPSSGEWWVLQSSSNYTTYVSYTWGVSTDKPVPGDYDGDGRVDIAIYRPSVGAWFVLHSSSNYTTYVATQWGISTDIPVSADYDGDGMTDIAIYRPSEGVWWIRRSSSSTVFSITWGVSGDIPVPGDYDGDGKADVAVYRASSGTWFVLQSSNSSTAIFAWGASGDQPVLKRE